MIGTTEMNRETHPGNLTFAELVRDPLVALVMKSDGVDRHSVEALFERIAQQRPRGVLEHHPRLCPPA